MNWLFASPARGRLLRFRAVSLMETRGCQSVKRNGYCWNNTRRPEVCAGCVYSRAISAATRASGFIFTLKERLSEEMHEILVCFLRQLDTDQ